MEESQYLLSVIVPLYNKASFLETCLQSIVEWGLQDIEVIIVDDGSNDGSSVIAREFADARESVRYYHQENRGVSSARNKGLQVAHGQYVTFVDADDLVREGSLADVVPYLHSYDVVICGTMPYGSDINQATRLPDATFLDETAKDVFVFHASGGTLGAELPKSATRFLSGCKHKFYRRDFLGTHHIKFDERLSRNEDVLYSMRCYRKSLATRTLPFIIYENRHDESSLVSKMSFQETMRNHALFQEQKWQLFSEDLKGELGAMSYFHEMLFSVGEIYAAHMQQAISKNEYQNYLTQLRLGKKYIHDIDVRKLDWRKRMAFYLLRKGHFSMVGAMMQVNRERRLSGIRNMG